MAGKGSNPRHVDGPTYRAEYERIFGNVTDRQHFAVVADIALGQPVGTYRGVVDMGGVPVNVSVTVVGAT
jgi:hypothetical protein